MTLSQVAQGLARGVLRLCGWTLLDLPERPRKAVIVGYPHTSNWDFPWGVLGLLALGLTPRWAGKDTLFTGWYGPIMRRLGGIPVNRREHTGFVERMVQTIVGSRDEFLLCIAPEGTRSRTEGWKSGFYRIARAADVPVIAGVIDYPRREIGLIGMLQLSGSESADMADIAALYAGRQGHTPAKASPIRLLK